MENLSALVKCLSPGEEKLIRHYYLLRNFGEYRKRGKLFDVVSKGKAKDERDLAAQVGYKTLNSTFHNLKTRLKSDITFILLMQDSSAKFNTPFAQALFSCRRALLTGELLLSRGVYTEGINLLKKASRLADKFEFFAERIMVEDTLRNYHAVTSDVHELKTGTVHIEKNYQLLGTMMRSKKKLYETVFSSMGNGVDENRGQYNTQAAVAEDTQIDSLSESSRISFYNKLSQLNRLSRSGDVKKALECAHSLLLACERDPIVMSKANQAGIHLEIATLNIRERNFQEAIQHAEHSKRLFKSGMVNHSQACIILFYGQAHANLIDKATVTLEQILNSPGFKLRTQKEFYNRIYLTAASFYFSTGNFERTSSCLKQCAELAKEKGNSQRHYVLLECLLLLEKKSTDAALYKLEALRKSTNRENGIEISSERFCAIESVLKKLIKDGANYQRFLNSNNKHLQLLKNEDDNCKWDPLGFEVLRIEKWLQKKANQAEI